MLKIEITKIPGFFWGHIDIGNDDECWVWTGATDGAGYGSVFLTPSRWGSDKFTSTRAHRVVYHHWNDGIPDGLVIDHLCFRRDCVNPFHLEAVTQTENVRRSIRAGRHFNNRQSEKTICSQGHEFTNENTYIDPKTGNRACRTCRNTRSAAHRKEGTKL